MKNKMAYVGSVMALALGSGILTPLGALASTETPFCIENGDCYSTLQAAFDAVPSDGTLTTIVLNSPEDVVYDGGAAFYERDNGTHPANGNYNVVLDFNGKTYVISNAPVGSTGYETQAFHVEKGGKIVLKNGTVKAASDSGVQMLFQNYADTTFENLTLDASENANISYVASNNFGSLTVKGDSYIIANANGVAFDLWYGMSPVYYDGVAVSFGEDFTGKVSGKVEYGRSGSAAAVDDWRDKTSLEIAGGEFDVEFAEGSAGALEGANIRITGGLFSQEVAYVAEGYKAIKTGENYVVSPLVTSIELGAGEEVVELMSNESQAMRIAYTPTDAAVDFEVSTNNSAIFAENSLRIEYDGTVPGLLFAAVDSGSGEAVVTVTEKNSGVSASVKVKVTEVLKSDSSIAEDGTTVYTYFETPIEGENLAVEISGEELSDAEKAKISPYLKAVYDVSVVNQDTDEVVPVSNNRIDVMLVLNPDDYEGMKYFKVVYINENGELAETFDTEVQTDEDGNVIALLFTTTHLSAYGVLASATEFPEVLAPDTGIGELMEAGSSYDYCGLVSTVVALTVMTVAMEIALWKRNQTRK